MFQENINQQHSKNLNRTRVGAVVVTYLPNLEDLQKLLESLYIQKEINSVVIVDNSANQEVFNQISHLVLQNQKDYLTTKILPQKENLGIAAALNIGVKFLENQELDWILTMDQDSVLPKEVIKEVLQKTNNLADEKISSIILSGEPSSKNEFEIVNMGIASGNLVKKEIFNEVNYFEESLFIDAVDTDFCFKVRLANYKILRFNHLNFGHKLGEHVAKSFFGRTIFYNQHGPIREYYIARNNLTILTRYWNKFPAELLIIFKELLKDFVKLLWFGEQKGKKIKMILLGIWHFLVGKKGKLNL